MKRLKNIHSVLEKDPQVGQVFSALEKKNHTKISIILFMVMKKNQILLQIVIL